MAIIYTGTLMDNLHTALDRSTRIYNKDNALKSRFRDLFVGEEQDLSDILLVTLKPDRPERESVILIGDVERKLLIPNSSGYILSQPSFQVLKIVGITQETFWHYNSNEALMRQRGVRDLTPYFFSESGFP